jgi:hypothetical protein
VIQWNEFVIAADAVGVFEEEESAEADQPESVKEEELEVNLAAFARPKKLALSEFGRRAEAAAPLTDGKIGTAPAASERERPAKPVPFHSGWENLPPLGGSEYEFDGGDAAPDPEVAIDEKCRLRSSSALGMALPDCDDEIAGETHVSFLQPANFNKMSAAGGVAVETLDAALTFDVAASVGAHRPATGGMPAETLHVEVMGAAGCTAFEMFDTLSSDIEEIISPEKPAGAEGAEKDSDEIFDSEAKPSEAPKASLGRPILGQLPPGRLKPMPAPLAKMPAPLPKMGSAGGTGSKLGAAANPGAGEN